MRLWLRLPPTLPEPLHDLWITPVPHDYASVQNRIEERLALLSERIMQAEIQYQIASASADPDQQRDAHATAPIPNRGEK